MINPPDAGAEQSVPNGAAERSSVSFAESSPTQEHHGSRTVADIAFQVAAEAGRIGGRTRLPLARRQKKLLVYLSLMLVLSGAGAGYVAALLSPPVYAARADILYRITQSTNSSLRQAPSISTQVALLGSRQVLAPVATHNRLPVEDLQRKVSISILNATEIIEIEARDRVRDTAMRLAQGIVASYLQAASADDASNADDLVNAQLADVDAKLAKAREQLLELAGLAAGSPALVSAEAGLQTLSQREQALQSELDNLQLAKIEDPHGGRVVVPPYLVSTPVSPQPMLAAATGALSGLLIAVIVVAALTRRWTRV